ncbi:beta strand repeat-containing protein [Pseudomonas frederiksbergensis]|uniref:beta strand repeat-containing protein n=1 Tax=Pseudomonas frederiksbergensis TaxID=104087 RepID=UPI003D1C96CC
MAIGTTGVNVSLDETSGLQNLTATPTPTGDADDNDILVASLPSTFATRLTALGAGTATGAALSGYTGDVNDTGSNAFTLTSDPGAGITDISFVDSEGAPLNGLDSGLDTLDGTSILLYTDTNNNILLGRAGGPTGAIVFAAYIEETGSPVTGGKIWTVEYQPLKHPVVTNADDSLNLAGKVFIGATQDANFSLAGAPSGQQLFLMFTTEGATADVDGRIPGVSIIVTGKNPLNQSASDAAITSADTVNSSQGGGNTTLGTNNQAITEQEGLRFSFVTGARADVTIPNLSPGEAGIEANIDFTQYFGARAATFQVVQETGGTTAKILLTAFKNVDNDLNGSQSGVNFIDSYADDGTEKVDITVGSVTVKTFAGVTISSAVITYNADGTVLITGIPTDSQITYGTATDHNRVLIENAGLLTAKNSDKTHADFDIGGFEVLQTSTSAIEIGSKMIFDDDGPSADVVDGGGVVTIDETAGNQDNDSDLAAVLALFDTEVTNKGTDLNPTEFAISTTPLATTTLSSFGQDAAGGTKVLSLAIVGGDGTDSLLNTTDGKDIKLFKEGNLIVGRYDVANGTVTADDPAAFAIALQQDGNVAVAQYVSLTHPVAGSSAADHDDRVDLAGLVNAVVTVTDGDGDTSTDSVGIGDDINFDDDGPSADVADGGGSVTIDETAGNQDNDSDAAAVLALFDTEVLNKGTDLSPAEFAISTTPLATTALSSFGQDQEGATKVLSLAIVGGDGTDSLLNTTDGKDIKLFKEGDLIIGRYDVANGTVTGADPAAFAIALLQDGNVAVAQYVSLTHPIAGSSAAAHDDQVNLAGLINAVVTVTDGDGDTSIDSVGIGGDINFDDDGPTVSANSTVLLDDDALTGGNPGGTDDDVNAANASGTLGHDFGQDGAGTVAYLTSGAPTGFTYVADGTSLLVKQGTTTVLTLTMVAATGAYSVVQNNPIAHAAGLNENNQAFTISYRVTDGDGDTADGTLGINVDDDTPVIGTAPVQDIDPTLGATSWTFSGDFAYSIGADQRGPTYSSAADSDFAELALSGTANDVAIVDPTVTWDSESLDAATFDVSFKYDHDRNAATDPELVEGTLVFDKVNDTYTFEMDALQTTQDVTLGEGTGYETYDVDGTSPSSGPSPVATGKLGEGFFIQITGFESPLSAGGNTVVTAGELVSGTQAPVTLSSTALGVSGNTIQAGEAANINFFQTDPKGDLGADNFSYATDFFIKFDGYETESDDLLLIVSLADANDPSITTTRAIYVDQGDVYENDTVNTDLVGTKYEALIVNDPADPNDPFLDNNDALLIVESNDFNIQTGDNWLIKGIQILSNDAGLTGSAINLNRNVGADGASSTSAQPVSGLVGPGNTIAEDTSTNPLKIIDAGFSTTTTTPATLDLTLDFKVVDSDSDFTAVQTIDIENPVVVELVGVTNLAPTDLVL